MLITIGIISGPASPDPFEFGALLGLELRQILSESAAEYPTSS